MQNPQHSFILKLPHIMDVGGQIFHQTSTKEAIYFIAFLSYIALLVLVLPGVNILIVSQLTYTT